MLFHILHLHFSIYYAMELCKCTLSMIKNLFDSTTKQRYQNISTLNLVSGTPRTQDAYVQLAHVLFLDQEFISCNCFVTELDLLR